MAVGECYLALPNPDANFWASESGHLGFRAMGFYGSILLSRPARRLLQLLRGSSSWRASLSLYHCDPGALSGVVSGPSLASTMKTASKLAGSLSLAFSLIL
jgi:hypothetical protein